jgi:hypothetical protein
MRDKAVIPPISRLLMSVKTDSLLVFLNTLRVTWSLSRSANGFFRAEIHLDDKEFIGEHTHIPHHALVEAVSLFLLEATLDYHEYLEE